MLGTIANARFPCAPIPSPWTALFNKLERATRATQYPNVLALCSELKQAGGVDSEAVFELFAIASTEPQLCVVAEDDIVSAVFADAKSGDAVEVDDGGAMDAAE